MGDECVGLVEAVGPRVKHVRPGDRVLVPAVISCGFCAYCTNCLGAQCTSDDAGPLRGAHAEYVRVPWASASLMRLPDHLTDEAALTLASAFPCGYYGTQLAQVRAGQAIAVFGAGPVGLFALKSAQLLGATRLFAIDHDLDRLDLAARQGVHPINFMDEEPIAALRELTGGQGVDACIEAVGMDALNREGERSPAVALSWSLEAVKPGGRVGVLGEYAQPVDGLPLNLAVEKSVTLASGVATVRPLAQPLLAILQQHLFDPTFVYTGAIDFEHLEDAYRLFDRHEHIKLIVRTEAGRAQLEKKSVRYGVPRMAWL